MSLKLPLQKPGEEAPKLRLSLTKGGSFSVELSWDSDEDLDAHALLATNVGNGAKISAFEQVLSAYNLAPKGSLTKDSNGSFATPCGTLTHSGDSRTGVTKDVDEIITIDGSKAPHGANEIPIVVTIHDPRNQGLTFGKVRKAGIRIRDNSGAVLADYHLSDEFGRFNAVQMGSLLFGQQGWEFAAVGSGFVGDFNTVLENFS